MKNNAIIVALLASAALLFSLRHISAATQTDIAGPPGSEQFGLQVTVLPNGNLVVTDPYYDAPGPVRDVGRVYLYNGKTLAVISTMTGTTANDFVGSDNSGQGVTVLANGDFVVRSSSWNGGRGAVTRCSASTGCPATINAANSLVGAASGNFVGSDGVVALPNGNYVVRSSFWDNGGATDAGALTWCDGTTGCTGNVSAANSRVGSSPNDQIGQVGLVILSNGNYVSQDLFWDNGAATDAGAVTFCSGTAPCTGAVSVANSLVGTTLNEFNGNSGIFPLTNGNYVVANGGWPNGAASNAGAVTFCNGASGCHAIVGPANSLIGTTADDLVGLYGVAVLSNGNYVVRSPNWNNAAVTDAGAATFCSGTAGCTNMSVSTANSLFGSSPSDEVGIGVTALTNGNYVVNSPSWDNVAASENNVGASTFCNGSSGRVGPVTAANSLIGPAPGDAVGGSAVPLTNGNYVVISQNWGNPMGFASGAGAVTFCSGTSGCAGEVGASNSLVGSTSGDNVGNVAPLTNGNYVVTAGFWDNGAVMDAGAATFCSGTSGCVGSVSAANSFVGTKSGDKVGGFNPAVALANGNYLINSPNWDNGATPDVGAITLCGGTSGCIGTVSASNSLIGSSANDAIGNYFQTTALPNGDYVLRSPSWDNGGIGDAGAVTIGLRNGSTVGMINANNSVRGLLANFGFSLDFSADPTNGQLVVGRSEENIVTVLSQTAPGTPIALKITSITRLGNGHIMLQGIGVPNATHEIERSLSLAPAGFGSIAQVSANGSGVVQFEDSTSTNLTMAFYRLAFP